MLATHPVGYLRFLISIAALGLLAALLLLPAPVRAQVTTEVPSDWSLIPTGLTTGDTFRLIFLSSTSRNSSSTDIAVYNTFVQERAAAGHMDIQTYSAGFRVVGCTAAVDARDNTSTTGTGVPIYWLGGSQVADDYADFYDGSWADEANDKNASGGNGPDTSVIANFPLTGCEDDGTEASFGGASQALGTSNVRVGRPNSSMSNHGPIGSNEASGATNTQPMYGLSQVFEVAAPPNVAPTFNEGPSTTRTVPENPTTVTNVGNAVAATDSDSGDTLTYALKSGDDSGSFTIVPTSGQIQTKTNVTYDFEGTKSSYTVNVTVHDGKDVDGDTDTTIDAEITVTINLTNVNEAPVITTTGSSHTTITKAEGTGTSVALATYLADDPEMGTLTWSKTGDDAGDFTIMGGVLKFSAVPDYENATDNDTNNTYLVTVNVRDDNGSTVDASLPVTITVTNVEEAGTATFTGTLSGGVDADGVGDRPGREHQQPIVPMATGGHGIRELLSH